MEWKLVKAYFPKDNEIDPRKKHNEYDYQCNKCDHKVHVRGPEELPERIIKRGRAKKDSIKQNWCPKCKELEIWKTKKQEMRRSADIETQ